MWFGVVTIFPELVQSALNEGVVGRAIRKGNIVLELINPRDFAKDSAKTVDDRPFGGGPGMVMMAEPLADCVNHARNLLSVSTPTTVLLSPQGERFDQSMARELVQLDSLLLIAGRYEGVDERFVGRYVDLEISIGDYVLSGGELAALVLIDAVGRLISGTLSNPESVDAESYSDGLLDFPQFTRPRCFEGKRVPEVLLSGDHAAVEKWRHNEAIRRTWERRPDLLLGRKWSETERDFLRSLECVANNSSERTV